MANAVIRPNPFPVTNDMIRAFLAREHTLTEQEVTTQYPDNIIDVVMSGDHRTYATWHRGAQRMHHGF